MEAAFSELQYAYSCTRELENRLGSSCSCAPYFPTLIEEAKFGFDVAIGSLYAPVFLQYKVADYMIRKSARNWKEFSSSFFRFSVYPATKSPQHNRLKSLSTVFPFVYYCSSAFVDYDQFDSFHTHGQIVDNSVFINLCTIPKNSGNAEHDIIFQTAPWRYRWCSDPIEVKGINGWDELSKTIREKREHFDTVDNIYEKLTKYIFSLLNIAEPDGNNDFQSTSLEPDRWAYISHLLGMYFNSSLILLKYKDK